MSSGLKIVFMGTPDFAVPTLRAILNAGHHVCAVYTRAPKPKGRGGAVQKSPVHLIADDENLTVLTPKTFRGDTAAAAQLAAFKPDLVIVAAYGLILPPEILAVPRYGCLNVHASLLPRWRGASPIHRAIWAGDATTGVTIMQMEAGLDTGPMIMADHMAIDRLTTPELSGRLAIMGARLIIRVLDDLMFTGHLHATPQPNDGVTLAPMLTKEDGVINWAQTAAQIECQIRALTPWPGTITHKTDGTAIKIISGVDAGAGPDETHGRLLDRAGHIACGPHTKLKITEMQMPNGKKMDVAAAINGGYLTVGDVLR